MGFTGPEKDKDKDPAAAAAAAAAAQAELKRRVTKLFEQLTVGCGYPSCGNEWCASSLRRCDEAAHADKTTAAAIALRLATNATARLPLCDVRGYARPLTIEELHELTRAAHGPAGVAPLVRRVGEVFGSPESLRQSFLPAPTTEASLSSFSENELEVVREAYALVESLDGGKLSDVISGSIVRLVAALRASPSIARDPATLRAIAFAFEAPVISDPRSQADVLGPLGAAVASLPDKSRAVLADMWARAFSPQRLREAALTLESAISTRILTREGGRRRGPSPNSDSFITAWVVFLEVLHRANGHARHPAPLSFREWYNAVLCEAIDIREDFVNWRFSKSPSDFSFCRFPFVLEPAYKAKLLQIESSLEQQRQRESALGAGMFFLGGPPPFLPLHVRRDHLLEDSLTELQGKEPNDLKKELRVKFRGEEGLDYGGVQVSSSSPPVSPLLLTVAGFPPLPSQKEWFQLIVQAVFDPVYGMFTLDEKTRLFWFNVNSDALADFRLVGMLLGLSVYNGVILDLRFPPVVYKKLKGIEPKFDDLRETHPEIHDGLTKLLRFEGDVESVFATTFSVEYDRYGAVVSHDLVPNGSHVAVTRENREEYVRLRTKFLLIDSVAQQFREFAAGFRLLCNSEAFNLFIAEELELVICGNPILDWRELEKSTRYDGGFSDSHPTIRAFWAMFHALPEDKKKLFLKFATGSDRSPVGGLSQLRLVIGRNGPDTDKLPTASTCFSHFLLPEYSSAEKMQIKFLQAIQNSTGFGLL